MWVAEIDKLPLRFVSPEFSRRSYLTGGKPTLSRRSIGSPSMTAEAEKRKLLLLPYPTSFDITPLAQNVSLGVICSPKT